MFSFVWFGYSRLLDKVARRNPYVYETAMALTTLMIPHYPQSMFINKINNFYSESAIVCSCLIISFGVNAEARRWNVEITVSRADLDEE